MKKTFWYILKLNQSFGGFFDVIFEENNVQESISGTFLFSF